MSNLENQIQIYKENLDKFLNSISDGTLDEQVTYIRENYDSFSNNEKQEIQKQIDTWTVTKPPSPPDIQKEENKKNIVKKIFSFLGGGGIPKPKDILDNIGRSTRQRIANTIPSAGVVANRIFNPRRPNRKAKIYPENFNKVNKEITVTRSEIADMVQDDNGKRHLIVFHITNNNKALVFRMANFTGLADTITPEFTQQKYFGRAEPYYQYSGVTRNISFTFDVVVHNRRDINVIYGKLNTLTSLAYPHKYTNNNMIEPNILKLSLADYIHEKPFFLTNISITGADDVVYQDSKPSIVTVNVQGNLLETDENPAYQSKTLGQYVNNRAYQVSGRFDSLRPKALQPDDTILEPDLPSFFGDTDILDNFDANDTGIA